MAELVVYVGTCTAQGVRENNEDRFFSDERKQLFIVADGMGGQEGGELASSMAVDIIPKIVHERLQANQTPSSVIEAAMSEANEAIINEGKKQPEGRRMGTTAVLALHRDNEVVIGNLGDSRAYLIRGDAVTLLTDDHSVAFALQQTGALTEEEAKVSPYQHVLHKFLGCVGMSEGPDIRPFTPEAGDRLLLGSDGLTNLIEDDDLRDGAKQFPNVQDWAQHLVRLALDRGSKDNVTCIVLAFEPE